MDAIHFGLIPGRKLTSKGDSDLRGLNVLFTLDETATLEKRGDEHFYRYQVDKAGLEHAIYLGKTASDALTTAIETIGKLIVHADLTELHPGDHALIGFLISSLGELTNKVNEASFAMAKGLADGHYLKDTGDEAIKQNKGNVAYG